VIDEVLTPDSSRFWPVDQYQEGRGQPSFDKQPLRDFLDQFRQRGEWDGNPPDYRRGAPGGPLRIAPEGRPFIGAGLVVLVGLVALGAWRGGWWIWPAVVWTPVALWIPWFFRDPARRGPRGDHLILAPADGRVVAVRTAPESSFMGGAATRVSVFMNVFDVHVNRYPVAGTVAHRHYRPGRFINATLDKASEENEQMSVGIRTVRGPLLVRQIAGLIARRIVTDAAEGDRVRQGERLGLIRFGSRVDTFVPPETSVLVEPGHRTTAGVTIIAEWST
jgi:phosphatidylserine decarboxylase